MIGAIQMNLYYILFLAILIYPYLLLSIISVSYHPTIRCENAT